MFKQFNPKEFTASPNLDITSADLGKDKIIRIEFHRSFLKTLEEPWHLVGIIADALKGNKKLSRMLGEASSILITSKRDNMKAAETAAFTLAAIKLLRLACMALRTHKLSDSDRSILEGWVKQKKKEFKMSHHSSRAKRNQSATTLATVEISRDTIVLLSHTSELIRNISDPGNGLATFTPMPAEFNATAYEDRLQASKELQNEKSKKALNMSCGIFFAATSAGFFALSLYRLTSVYGNYYAKTNTLIFAVLGYGAAFAAILFFRSRRNNQRRINTLIKTYGREIESD